MFDNAPIRNRRVCIFSYPWLFFIQNLASRGRCRGIGRGHVLGHGIGRSSEAVVEAAVDLR